MKVAFLHTANVHVETFNHLTAILDVEVEHMVRTDLLVRAQKNGLASVRAETMAALETLSQADAVVCTCSTLGPIVDEYAQFTPHILRIDRPLMQAALDHVPNIVVAICIKSTEKPTLDLLQNCADEAGVEINPQVILCDEAWAHFEAGNQAKYAQSIATQIRAETSDDVACVILAQASMRVAEALLQDLGIAILSSPQLAVDAAINIANGSRA